ncbi:hypothetical protein HHL17_33260 [Chitinophaga sp. G-6-1-13]|uniref:Uncharacterized protein n=1 Tax=Chitinophaga fulva TaxID=2728842 RepID=A0A848GZY0_9BACT|nr:hypothetical protein [Chitinophaga fulva]NML42103.1 hypothetical protein [Chitinophaga fulva]
MTDEERFMHLRSLLLPAYAELEKELSKDDPPIEDYHFFESERERFLFVFKRRQRNKDLNREVAAALANVITSFESTTDEMICTNSVTKGELYFLAYTDVSMTVLFGALVFRPEVE